MTVADLTSAIARAATGSLTTVMSAVCTLGLMAGDYGLAAIGPIVVWITWRSPVTTGTCATLHEPGQGMA
jgi:hypothetical protein